MNHTSGSAPAYLAIVYVRLARREEREAAAQFGQTWTQYARATPGWSPRIRRARIAHVQASSR